jgi:hypothetical protein
MSSFGFPADMFAQSNIRPKRETAPPAPIPPKSSSGRCTSSLPATHGKAIAWEAPAVTTLSIRASAYGKGGATDGA